MWLVQLKGEPETVSVEFTDQEARDVLRYLLQSENAMNENVVAFVKELKKLVSKSCCGGY